MPHNAHSKRGSSLALIVALICISGCAAFAQHGSPLPAGSDAPEIQTTTLDGQQVSLARFRGHVLLVDIWAIWCPDCRKTLPAMEQIAEKTTRYGVYVVGISTDTEKTGKFIPAAIKKFGIRFPISARPEENAAIAQTYNANYIPALYLIDKQGKIRWSSFSFKPGDVSKVTAMILQLSKE